MKRTPVLPQRHYGSGKAHTDRLDKEIRRLPTIALDSPAAHPTLAEIDNGENREVSYTASSSWMNRVLTLVLLASSLFQWMRTTSRSASRIRKTTWSTSGCGSSFRAACRQTLRKPTGIPGRHSRGRAAGTQNLD